MFKIGEYAVCPGHGVAQVCDIEEKEVAGTKKSFYILKTIDNGMKIMVPTDSENGVRELVSNEKVDEVYDLLSNHDVKLDHSTWNRRYRDYVAKIKTGSLLEIAEVLRELVLLKNEKSLSFGEKKMLEQCKELLTQEISISKGQNKNAIASDIDSCFTP